MPHPNDHAEAVPMNAIDMIIEAAVPERATGWRDLRDRLSVTFHVIEDRSGVTMQARGRRVEFDHKTMAWIWLLGFTGWEAFRVHGPHVFWSNLTVQPIDDLMRANDAGYATAQIDYDTLMYALRDFAALQDFDDKEDWPEGIPPIQKDKAGMNIEEQAAFDLTMIATAYVLLHEVRHVEFTAAGTRPTRSEEEMTCDAFARDFILTDIAKYAATTGQDAEDVLAKRAAGIAIGVYALYGLTPASNRGGSTDYPPVADRIEALFPAVSLPDGHWFWDFAGSLLVALVVSRQPTAVIPPLSGASLLHALVAMIRTP